MKLQKNIGELKARLERVKKSIIATTDAFLETKRAFVSEIEAGAEAFAKIKRFYKRGKMVRGGFLLMGYELLGRKKATASIIALAGGLELIHAGFLIQDDVMDEDETRRGEPTVAFQYRRQFGEKERRLADSLAICVGDLCFFLGLELMNQARSLLPSVISTFSFCFQEFQKVSLGQMADLIMGQAQTTPSVAKVFTIHRFKAARYTFSLPLRIAAEIAGTEGHVVEKLEQFGEYVGTLFQLKDDEMGLFGDQTITGKPVGSDIQQDKKTLYRILLTQRAATQDKKRLGTIFGSPQVSAQHLKFVRSCVRRYGVDREVKKYMQASEAKAREIVETIDEGALRQFLETLIVYNAQRSF